MDTGIREILVVTGTRAEYGLLKSSMEAIQAHDDLSLSVVATGMHLLPQHGRTVTTIREDGFPVDREVSMLVEGDSGAAMAKSLGVGTMGLTDAIASLDSDIVLVLGDRDETLAAALAAAHMNIPVAHIHGGDSMHGAMIDDSIRHALTKFAHLHFPVSTESADRIRKLGEQDWRITTVGAPGLDDILAGDYDDPVTVRDRYDLDSSRPLLVVLQHPVTLQPDAARSQFETTFDAVDAVDAQVVVIYPNSDPGSDRMIDALQTRTFANPTRTFRNLPRREFLGLLAAADVLVGNSSSGIIEAPSLDLPVVDIGPRQEDRQRNDNVLSVTHDEREIREGIETALTDEFQTRASECGNCYDFGGAGERICDRLATVETDDDLLRKRLTYS